MGVIKPSNNLSLDAYKAAASNASTPLAYNEYDAIGGVQVQISAAGCHVARRWLSVAIAAALTFAII